MHNIKEAERIARKCFGYKALTPIQRKAITAVLGRKNVFCLLSTGAGKSAIYQIPSLLMDGPVIVFSPLIALMRDQTQKLKKWGVKAERINSEMDDYEVRRSLRKLSTLNLLYVAPERLQSSGFIDTLVGTQISYIVVDESHVLSQQQQNFRPAYALIGKLCRRYLPHVPIVALTATADPFIEKDIVRSLGMKKYTRITAPIERPNLTYRVTQEFEPRHIADWLKKHSDLSEAGSVIIYAATRVRVEQIAENLRMRGFSVEGYHAGMNQDDRADIQDRFMQGATRIIVATNAFGMGIDKPDVRVVFHADPPGDVMAYAQEAGRAGRDGKPSTCVLNMTAKGIRSRKLFIRTGNPKLEVFDSVWDRVFLAHPPRQPFILNTWEVERAVLAAGGVSSFEAPMMVESLLSYMEYRNLIVRKPEKAVHKLEVRNRPLLFPWIKKYPTRVKIKQNEVFVTLHTGDEDFIGRMLVSGAVSRPRYSRPTLYYRCLRRKEAHGIEQDALDEKHLHEVARLDSLLMFARTPDKHAFLRSLFEVLPSNAL